MTDTPPQAEKIILTEADKHFFLALSHSVSSPFSGLVGFRGSAETCSDYSRLKMAVQKKVRN